MITTIILYWFGQHFGTTIITSFATTLFIGVAVSMFTAILVTRTFLRLLVASGRGRSLALYGVEERQPSEPVVLEEPLFDIIGKRYWFFSVISDRHHSRPSGAYFLGFETGAGLYGWHRNAGSGAQSKPGCAVGNSCGSNNTCHGFVVQPVLATKCLETDCEYIIRSSFINDGERLAFKKALQESYSPNGRIQTFDSVAALSPVPPRKTQ